MLQSPTPDSLVPERQIPLLPVPELAMPLLLQPVLSVPALGIQVDWGSGSRGRRRLEGEVESGEEGRRSVGAARGSCGIEDRNGDAWVLGSSSSRTDRRETW